MRSAVPLEVYVDKKFYLRGSNKDFTMWCTKFADKEIHHSFSEEAHEHNIFGEQYVEEFNKEHAAKGVTWVDMEEKIHSALRKLFKAY